MVGGLPRRVTLVNLLLSSTCLPLPQDLVYISNPFDALHRDADIESSSDGFDGMAYGSMASIHDETMGWGGGGLYMQTFTWVRGWGPARGRGGGRGGRTAAWPAYTTRPWAGAAGGCTCRPSRGCGGGGRPGEGEEGAGGVRQHGQHTRRDAAGGGGCTCRPSRAWRGWNKVLVTRGR